MNVSERMKKFWTVKKRSQQINFFLAAKGVSKKNSRMDESRSLHGFISYNQVEIIGTAIDRGLYSDAMYKYNTSRCTRFVTIIYFTCHTYCYLYA